jgi:hypothetical protein
MMQVATKTVTIKYICKYSFKLRSNHVNQLHDNDRLSHGTYYGTVCTVYIPNARQGEENHNGLLFKIRNAYVQCMQPAVPPVLTALTLTL